MNNLTSISCGYGHYAAITPEGQIVCWGDPMYKSLYDVPPELEPGFAEKPELILLVVCGYGITCALTSEGRVVCWGNYADRYKVPENALSGIVSILCGFDHVAALTEHGQVVCWGNNGDGQCNVPKKLESMHVIQIACGYGFTAALTSNGRVIC